MTEKVVETQAEYTSGTIYIDPGTSSVLVCPICVGEKHKPNMNLHQGTVEVYIRGKEDSLSGTHVLVEESNNENMGKGAIFADHDVEDGNPSVRRDGLKIAFRCEYHDDPLMLNIFQRKGITYFQWDNTDEERGD